MAKYQIKVWVRSSNHGVYAATLFVNDTGLGSWSYSDSFNLRSLKGAWRAGFVADPTASFYSLGVPPTDVLKLREFLPFPFNDPTYNVGYARTGSFLQDVVPLADHEFDYEITSKI